MDGTGDSPAPHAAAPWLSYPPPGAPSPSPSRPTGRFRRWFARRIYRDAAVVALIAVSMSLSAYSVFQATRAADEARDLYNQARQLEAEIASQDAHLQTIIDGDLAALGEYCAAKEARDAVLPTVFSIEPDTRTLVKTDATATMMRSLLQGDRLAGCDPPHDGYSTDRAVQAVRDASAGIAPPQSGVGVVQRAADRTDRAEQVLMLAGFLFALVVGMLVVVDAIGGRRRERGLVDGERDAVREWLALLWPVPFAVGLVLLAVFGIDQPLSVVIAIAALALVVVGGVMLARHPVQADAGDGDAATPRWIAELVGAAIIVLFALGALGFTHLAVQERDATARADHIASLADDLQQVARHESLRELAAIDLLARTDAEISVSQQPVIARDTEEDYSTRMARLDDLAGRLQGIEDDLRATTRGMVLSRSADACPDETRAPTSIGTTLLDDISRSPGTLQWRLWQNQEAARACDVVAALVREEARTWAGHGSTFTVALVLLGLAGFVLALAADADRTRKSATALLIIGGAGAVIGLGIMVPATPDIMARASVPSAAQVRSLAAAVTFDYGDPCPAVKALDEAIAAIPDYGPAYAARAEAAAVCDENTRLEGIMVETIGSGASPEAVVKILADMERAVAIGPTTPLLSGNLAWYRILYGIQTEDEGALRSGLALTTDVVDGLERSDDSSGTLLHTLRFNAALANLALGQSTAAEADYAHALDCVNGVRSCPGDDLSDPEVAARVVLGALGDLELLDDRHDDVRRMLLEIPAPAPDADPVKADLDVYPLEFQVRTRGDERPFGSVIWYVRHPPGAWAIVAQPSLETMYEGDRLNHPIATDEATGDLVFRADVFIDGVLADVRTTKGAAPDVVRVASRRLGMSAAVPSDWTVLVDDGVEWQVGPDPDADSDADGDADADAGLTVRRVEGIPGGTDLVGDLHAWAGVVDPSEVVARADPWILGAPEPTVERWGDRYIGTALLPYGSDAGCGGTAVQVLAAGGDDATASFGIFDSLVLDRPVGMLSDQDGTLVAGELEITLPAGWDAALGMPDGVNAYASAGSCTDGAYVDVWREGPWAANIDEAAASLSESQAEIGNVVFGEEELDIEGAEGAAVVDYGWDLDTDAPRRGRTILAMRDGIVWRVVLTDMLCTEENAAALDLVVDSLRFDPDAGR